MPPVAAAVATLAGAFLAIRFLKKEWERVNRELDAVPVRVTRPQTLYRDPVTGVWRPR